MRIREPDAMTRQAIDVRSADTGCAVATDVAVTQIVGVQQDNIRPLHGSPLNKPMSAKCGCGAEKRSASHGH
jgi:predicted TIM-barrel enzyme